MTRSAHTTAPSPVTVRSWRVTTAVRVFAVALALGQVLSDGQLNAVGVVAVALALIAAVSCAIEAGVSGWVSACVPVVEGAVVAVLLGTTDAPVTPLLVYLAIPPVVAGLRHGWVTTANTYLATGLALFGAWTATDTLDLESAVVSASLTWLVLGLGVGLLASWQTRSMRALVAAQAPYAAAHRLVAQLRTLTRELPMGLDSVSVGASIDALLREKAGAGRSAILVLTPTGEVEPLVTHGPVGPSDDQLARETMTRGRVATNGGAAALPLRVGDHVVGAVILNGRNETAWTSEELGELQSLLDEQAVRLDTALLFDDVRSLATTEERNRLARDIHDGVAQEIVSLGYMADEIAAASVDPSVLQSVDDLRAEISRVISELRFSIFDLRHDVDEAGSFSGALAEYVREVGAQGDLRVHLLFDERGPRLPQRTEVELLRIAQEAIGNVRKHARAVNLWVTMVTDNGTAHLVVEDDGTGSASPRDGHYGLHTMRERADRINADLSIAARPDGGTRVTLQSRTPSMLPM